MIAPFTPKLVPQLEAENKETSANFANATKHRLARCSSLLSLQLELC